MLKNYPISIRIAFVLLSLVLLFFILISAKLFLYPIALAILFAYLLYPFANFLEKRRFPRILAILISIIVLLTIVTFALLYIYKRVSVFVGDFPTFRAKALGNIDLLESKIGGLFGLSDLRIVDFLRARVAGLFDAGSDFFNKVFSATTGTIFRIGILPVFIFFILFYRTKFAYFILKLVPKEKQILTVHILRQVSTVASRYMGGMFTVVIVLCFLNSLCLILIGLKYAIVLGVIAAMFCFIPYFGNIIGYSIPFLFALLTGDSPNMALRVFLVFVIVQFTENNILTPNIVGNYVKLNPFTIILGIIAGGLVWGIPGMFVVIPALAIFRIICEHVESLQPYTFLLGTTGVRKYALTAENIRKFIDRLGKRKL